MDSYVRGQISRRDSVNLHTVTVRRCFSYCRKREEVVDVYTLCVVCVRVRVCGGRERKGEGRGEREGGGRERKMNAFSSLLIVCNYTQWGAWSECSTTCDTGVRTRYRESRTPPTVPELCDRYSDTTECRLISCRKCAHIIPLFIITPPPAHFMIIEPPSPFLTCCLVGS